jgi:hypothetical protein
VIGRGRTSGERPWELRADRHDPDYGRHKDEGKVKGTKSHDFWFGDEPCEEPPSWTLEDLYEGRWNKQISGFFSGQAKSLLEPLGDTSGVPKTADEPGADEWRERLEQALAAYVVVGTQDRLDETIDALGALPGIHRRELYQVRVQRGRPATSSLEPRVAELIRRHNWLDEELYRLANERLDARAR